LTQRHAKIVVVDRQWAANLRGARKKYKANAVAGKCFDAIEDRRFGILQPVRMHVFSEHAARHVEQEDHIAPGFLQLLFLQVPRGAGEGEDHQRDRRTAAERFALAADERGARTECLNGLLAFDGGIEEQSRHGGNQPKPNEHIGIVEVEGH